jgi:hypothetical protein
MVTMQTFVQLYTEDIERNPMGGGGDSAQGFCLSAHWCILLRSLSLSASLRTEWLTP